jgi:hypothetical protein
MQVVRASCTIRYTRTGIAGVDSPHIPHAHPSYTPYTPVRPPHRLSRGPLSVYAGPEASSARAYAINLTCTSVLSAAVPSPGGPRPRKMFLAVASQACCRALYKSVRFQLTFCTFEWWQQVSSCRLKRHKNETRVGKIIPGIRAKFVATRAKHVTTRVLSSFKNISMLLWSAYRN